MWIVVTRTLQETFEHVTWTGKEIWEQTRRLGFKSSSRLHRYFWKNKFWHDKKRDPRHGGLKDTVFISHPSWETVIALSWI